MGAYLSSPVVEKETDDGENELYRYGAAAMQGWRVDMEDAHLTRLDVDDKHSAVFGVYDGHGGKEVAIFCSRHLTEELVKSDLYKGEVGAALQATYLRMDDMIMEEEGRRELLELSGSMKNSGPQRSKSIFENEDMKRRLRTAIQARNRGGGSPVGEGSEGDSCSNLPITNAGCTAITAYVCDDQLVVANSGDSRGVLSRRGVSEALSVDHKPTDELECRRILRAGGYVSDGRINGSLNLSRAIGDMEYKEVRTLPPQDQMVTAWPEIKSVKLGPGDEFIILACDGIWDVLTNQEAVDFVRERLVREPERDVSSICSELCDRCLAKDTNNKGIGCDNMSVVIITLKKWCEAF